MLRKTKTFISVGFQREGIHCYPEAKNIPGVEFLAHPHRHMFWFKVKIEVTHDNRDIEFILFKRFCESLYDEKTLQLDYKSCEMMADELAEKISAEFPGRDIIIRVYEDNENGSDTIYTWEP